MGMTDKEYEEDHKDGLSYSNNINKKEAAIVEQDRLENMKTQNGSALFNSVSVFKGDLTEIFRGIARSIGISDGSISVIEENIGNILNSSIKYVPIKHNSPSSAFVVKKMIKYYKPKLVLIEGPSDCDHLIQYLSDNKTKLPVSILSLFSDKTNIFGLNGILSPSPDVAAKFQAFYPIISYSPEYIALKEAVSHHIPVHFIDLPFFAIIPFLTATLNLDKPIYQEDINEYIEKIGQKLNIDDVEDIISGNNVIEDMELNISIPKGAADATGTETDPKGERASSVKNNGPEHILFGSQKKFIDVADFYKEFCDVFQFEDFDELWDTLFESTISYNADIKDIQVSIKNILLFSMYIRETFTPNILDYLEIITRERYMKARISHLIKKYNLKESDVMVITGALHSSALLSTAPSNKLELFEVELEDFSNSNINTKGTSTLKQDLLKNSFNSLIPFSYKQFYSKMGYESGNSAPLYYEKIWNYLNAPPKKRYNLDPWSATALDSIINVYTLVRFRKYPVSLSDSISTFNNTKMLAMMRRRNAPIIRDIIDAIYMSLVKGDPEVEGRFLKTPIEKSFIGYRVGRVTPKIGKLPLQYDFYLKLGEFEIELVEEPQKIELNLKEDFDNLKSQFLHQLSFLGLDITYKSSGPDILKNETGIFKEIWIFEWKPNIDSKLIELNIYGSTIEEASINKLIEEAYSNIKNFAKITYFLFQALRMGFQSQFMKLYYLSSDALKEDTYFFTLAEGFLNLLLIFRYIKIYPKFKTIINSMESLIVQAYHNICFKIPLLANIPQDDEIKFLSKLSKIQNILQLVEIKSIDLDIFTNSIINAIEHSSNYFIIGGLRGLLYLNHKVSVSEIKNELITYLISSYEVKLELGNYIRGLIFITKTKLILKPEIIKILDQILNNLDWNIFISILPALRKTFSSFDRREYDIFIEKLSELYGFKMNDVTELKESLEERSTLFLKEIDLRVKELFEKWF